MGSVLEGWAFRMEEGEGVLNKTLKTKTTFSNTDNKEASEGVALVKVDTEG